MFQKILIANRGEIAVRIIRACREMGIQTVAVYSKADQNALHTQLADECICIGEAPATDSYLNMEQILSATVSSGADAIHPGFGFLSENAKFTRLCEACNISYIGPDAEVIERLGNKSEARDAMIKAGVPVVPGTTHPVRDVKDAMPEAAKIGYPVMIKAALGGGGKGMRVVRKAEEFESLFIQAQQETIKAFADDSMYLEKYIEHPRHIEFQILADQYGDVIHLGERDCTVQRRHQKMLEESPSPVLNEKLRKEMGEVAVKAARAVNYCNAGTIEFLLDQDGSYYFMEANTRIQVEHGVTEMYTGTDLIKEQIRIASGEHLHLKQEDIRSLGHVIEARINAEDPDRGFMPCPGRLESIHIPGGNGVRIDTAVYSGYEIPPYYDSMIMKVIVQDVDRDAAIRKMKSVLGELVIEGIHTNLDFQYSILEQKDFVKGRYDTGFIQKHYNL